MVVLAVLAAALAVAFRRGLERTRRLALAAGLGLAALYYAAFVPMVVEQLPRLLEGGGQGRGASRGPLDALRLQGLGLLWGWGPAAIALAAAGRPRPGTSGLDRSLAAYWAAGGVLALLAVVSPVETRYLYALSVPVAAAAAAGALRLWGERPSWRRWSVAALLAAQALLAGRNAVDAVLHRYR
jgi:hypothetical protein